MGDASEISDFSHLQDVFGNVPMVKRYTLLSLFFNIEPETTVDKITNALNSGLDKLGSAIPHLKGHVIFEGKTETTWGKAKVLPHSDRIPLITKDLRSTNCLPSMSQLAAEGYPFRHLHPSILIPESELPPNYTSDGPYLESHDRPARVLVIQATHIFGGLILTFASNHTTMDMNGLGQTICLLAKACRNEPFTTTEIAEANQPRTNAVPLLDESYTPGPESKYFIFPPAASPTNPASSPTTTTAPPPPPPAQWCYISLSPTSQKQLKSLASTQTITPYISTNDTLTAYFWRLITRSRARRLGPSIPSELNRQLSARRLLGLPDTYTGHMTASTHTHIDDPHTRPLPEVAGRLRQDLLDLDTLRFHTQAMATVLERLPPDQKTKVGYGASLEQDRFVVASSYAEIGVTRVEWGPVLGVACAARRPRAMLSPGLVYLMPADADGRVVAAVCLREDDLQGIREDEEFVGVAEYLG